MLNSIVHSLLFKGLGDGVSAAVTGKGQERLPQSTAPSGPRAHLLQSFAQGKRWGEGRERLRSTPPRVMLWAGHNGWRVPTLGGSGSPSCIGYIPLGFVRIPIVPLTSGQSRPGVGGTAGPAPCHIDAQSQFFPELLRGGHRVYILRGVVAAA